LTACWPSSEIYPVPNALGGNITEEARGI